MTPDMTLTEFLRARFDEDTVAATLRHWHDEECDSRPEPAGYTYPCAMMPAVYSDHPDCDEAWRS